MRIALILGGPSKERGISLNSARSAADHLDGQGVELAELVYFDSRVRPFAISRSLLYSNTPSDFDFKLGRISAPLGRDELAERLRSVDIVFPAIHGAFGEDGQLQKLLEELGVPYVGSPPEACLHAHDKYLASRRPAELGLPAIETHIADPEAVAALLARAGTVVLKPARGGSSLDLFVATELPAALDRLDRIAANGAFVVQPRLTGIEFTVVVVEGPVGPVALPPVEIELLRHEPDERFLTYRHKYLATNDARYHCPPRFAPEVTARARAVAEQVFAGFGLRDFARIDGWLTTDGETVVSDINPISGMEQNSFLFLQAASLGMSHSDALAYVLGRACARHGLPPPGRPRVPEAGDGRQELPGIFGGPTAERQVSVLSGTNVWLKLRGSARYFPIPYLLRPGGRLWRVPYAGALRHTAEEIDDYCRRSAAGAVDGELADEVARRLGLGPSERSAAGELAEDVGLDELLARFDRVFLALHGGEGENGELQRLCEEAGV